MPLIQAAGIRQYYRLEGADPKPVLIFSHSLGCDHTQWDPQAEALLPHFRILRYDLRGSHPLVGRSAPDFELADGTRLGERLRHGQGLLLDFDAHPALQALASRWSERISYVAENARERLGLSALLVRPDGVVAWAANAEPDLEEAALATPLWFGEPG